MVFECNSPKDVQKVLQVTWSNRGDVKYEQNNYLTFIVVMESPCIFF